mgnify:CR=1|tara:strand:- start:29325 stop:29462 length:138 start_codon:yes stop_codon:yes gene_type:complete
MVDAIKYAAIQIIAVADRNKSGIVDEDKGDLWEFREWTIQSDNEL